jgi:hypothetical protein
VLRIGILPRLNRSQRFGRDGGSVRRLTSPVNRATSVPSSEPRILGYFNVLSAFSLELWRPHCFILSRLARPRTSVRLLTSTEVERSSMSLSGVPWLSVFALDSTSSSYTSFWITVLDQPKNSNFLARIDARRLSPPAGRRRKTQPSLAT